MIEFNYFNKNADKVVTPEDMTCVYNRYPLHEDIITDKLRLNQILLNIFEI